MEIFDEAEQCYWRWTMSVLTKTVAFCPRKDLWRSQLPTKPFCIQSNCGRSNGGCSARKLAEAARISRSSAQRAIDFSKEGQVVIKRPGRLTVELGSCYGLPTDHHMLYLWADDYCSKIFQITGIRVLDSFISRYALLLLYILVAINLLQYYRCFIIIYI